MASPPLSQLQPWDFVGSLDSNWHGHTILDSSNNIFIPANNPINIPPLRGTGRLFGVNVLDPVSTQTTIVSGGGGDATPTPGWED